MIRSMLLCIRLLILILLATCKVVELAATRPDDEGATCSLEAYTGGYYDVVDKNSV